MACNLLLTGAWTNAGANVPALEEAGYDVRFMQQEVDALPCDAAWPEAVVCNGLFEHHDIRKFTQLRFIQLTSAGTDRVPEDYIRQAGIVLRSAHDIYSIPMAEHAVAGALALYRQLPAFIRQQDARMWKKRRELRELAGSTVCIMGCGSVGTECARHFSALGCKVIGVSSTPRSKAHQAAPTAPFDTIVGPSSCRDFHVFQTADIVILAVPLTSETHHLVDAAFLENLQADSVVVNLSRGAVVDEPALVAALTAGRLGGAVLDVFEEEPLPSASPLWGMSNVLITPHNSFAGTSNAARLDALIMRNLTKLLANP